MDPHGEVRQVPLAAIRPSPENAALYRPVDPEAADIRALAANIAETGVLEPLVISGDGYLLSGHRRYVAAHLAGLQAVPARTAPSGMTPIPIPLCGCYGNTTANATKPARSKCGKNW